MLHNKGPLLTVDVGERTATETDIDDVLRQFVGGRGVGTRLAHERIPFDADPFGPENRVFVTTGPLQTAQMSFTGRMSLTGLSPLTDGLLSTNAGGFLSRNFVGTGYSAVEVVGQSDELLAIHVTDGVDERSSSGSETSSRPSVEFEEVPELEGALVSEVTEALHERHGLEAENLMTIGPAGEHLVRFASVMTTDTRAFGRGGLGAVLGSKNVKTVSFEGDSAPDIDVDQELQSEIHREAATADDNLRVQGTTGGTEFINAEFSLPTRYFSEYHFEHAADIGGDAVEEKKYKKGSCSVCAFACKLPTRDEETGLETEGPEFETVFSFGSNQGIGDIVDVMQSNKLCDEYGMDTISAGNAIAAYLAAHDEFGNAELVHELVPKVARREDEGDLLAEGVARIHDELGVENFSVKGLEFAAHDGRVCQGQGLSYALANRGADHMYATLMGKEYAGVLDPEGTQGKAAPLIEAENRNAVRDSGVFCAFSSSYIDDEAMATLLDTDYERLDELGSQVVELERHFNNQRGLDVEDDRLPYDLPDLETSIQEYYELRGWTENGVVPDEHLTGVPSASD